MTDKDQSPITLADELAHRDWWKVAGDVLGLRLFGWTARNLASFDYVHPDFDHRLVIQIDGELGKRLYTADPTAAYQRGREDMRREAANTAAMFSINQTPLHPDIPWEKMSREAKAVEHTTCQEVAHAILDLPQAKAAETGDEQPRLQTTHQIAEIIAKFGSPPSFSWAELLADDIETVLNIRCAPSAIPEAVCPKSGDTIAIRVVVESFGDGVVKFRSDDGTLAYRRVTDIVAPLPKPAPGQGELRYYTLGPNADRVCTRCEFNLSADARDHQWVHDQKRDEAVRAGRERAARIARAGCLVPPDGGSPTNAERAMCEAISLSILGESSEQNLPSL